MNNKIKYISIALLTIIMMISVKFGKINDTYYLDLEVERLYREMSGELQHVEEVFATEGVTDYEIQEAINNARAKVEEVRVELIPKTKVKEEEVIPKWTLRLDEIQQTILNKIHIATVAATELRLQEYIDIARNTIPSNFPEAWKKTYEDILDNIEPYENVSSNIYISAISAYETMWYTINNKKGDANTVQNNINSARVVLLELRNAVEAENSNAYLDMLGAWSVTLDTIQQGVLNNIERAIAYAEETWEKEDIEVAKSLVPYALPKEWKEFYLEKINNL